MKTNLAGLRAAATKNKGALAVLGAAAVAAIAWRARAGNPATAPAGEAGPVASAPFYSVGAQTGATTGGYDSGGSDVYNALQPQIEALSNLIDRQQQQTTPVPVPVPDVVDEPVDPRRDGIASFYQTILNRTAGRNEINYWDATGKTLADIRTGIVNSPEAQGR